MLLVVLVITAALGILALRWHARRKRRGNLLASTLTESQRAILREQVPLVGRLPPHLMNSLEGKVNLFRDQIKFIGCDGLEVTEEMEISIAAQACLLVVNSPQWYDHLRTILVYPGAFKSRQIEHQGYVVTESDSVRLGESWARGPIVLSWADAEHGALDHGDGQNVVFHEFAHQLDMLSGHTDGAPLMNEGQSFATWERVILEAFDRHLANVEAGRPTVLDAYGAEGHEEFFAVAVEAFFEIPDELKLDEPEVYQQLSEFFRLDPEGWLEPERSRDQGRNHTL